MTAPGLRIWYGIEAEDPPYRRDDHGELLAMAESMLAARQRRFPAMIDAGRIDRATADAELATFAAIVADWRWICTGEGHPGDHGTLAARIDALDASLSTIADIARDQGGFSEDLAIQAERVIALRWHLEPGRRTHEIAAFNHALRARPREAAHAH